MPDKKAMNRSSVILSEVRVTCFVPFYPAQKVAIRLSVGQRGRFPTMQMTFHVTESFPFGDVAMSYVSSPDLNDSLFVNRIAFAPTLPDGMTVDIVAAYRIGFVSTEPIHNFSFDIKLTECNTKGDRNSGEYLDAQTWGIDGGILMLGTEDGDALHARMPWLNIDGDRYPVEYLHNGFRMVLPYIGPDVTVGFHFVLAFSQIDSFSDSEWFAVDISHDKLSNFPVEKRLA